MGKDQAGKSSSGRRVPSGRPRGPYVARRGREHPLEGPESSPTTEPGTTGDGEQVAGTGDQPGAEIAGISGIDGPITKKAIDLIVQNVSGSPAPKCVHCGQILTLRTFENGICRRCGWQMEVAK